MNRRDAKTQSKNRPVPQNHPILKRTSAYGLRVSASLRLIVIAITFVMTGCSLPSLEKPECMQARDAVKQFYSFHFGNDMHPTAENLKARERYLTSELFGTLSVSAWSRDYFTASDEFPKTFKIGKCEAPQPDKANVQVQLYWRDDTKTVQKEVNVEAVNRNDAWLINKVSN